MLAHKIHIISKSSKYTQDGNSKTGKNYDSFSIVYSLLNEEKQLSKSSKNLSILKQKAYLIHAKSSPL